MKKSIPLLLLVGLLVACSARKFTSTSTNITVFKSAVMKLDETETPQSGYWGIRWTGLNLSSLISLKQLNDLLPCPLYKSGPHTTENWDFYSENSFGYYNPQAIAYLDDVTDNLLADQQFVNATRPLIDKHLRPQMRILLDIYQYIDTMSQKEELLAYMVLPKEAQRELMVEVEGSLGEEMDYPDYLYQWWNTDKVDKGNPDSRFDYFWARRHKDGTDKQIYQILEKVNATYFGESNLSKEEKQ